MNHPPKGKKILNISDKIAGFFTDTPCSSLEIPDCEELRDSYKKQFKRTKGCAKCKKTALKRKFSKLINERLRDGF